jgi:hypothetical protein
LSSIRPKLLIEIHPPQLTLCGGSEDKLFQRLREHRYHWAIIDRNPNSLYSIFAVPKPRHGAEPPPSVPFRARA